jgi:hypothetical protein
MKMKIPDEDANRTWSDPIVAEVRAARAALWAHAGGDMAEFLRQARESQAGSGHPIIAPPEARKPEPGRAS